MEKSPWSGPTPTFKELPKENPRTGKPPVLFYCSLCGSVVVNRKLHIQFHESRV